MARGTHMTPGGTSAARSTAIGSTTDTITGRVTEAVGVRTEHDRLTREGQTDQVVGEVQDAAERAAERAAEQVKDTVTRVVAKGKQT
jgi:uncharacterized protein YjbJ (UPF0337 family)